MASLWIIHFLAIALSLHLWGLMRSAIWLIVAILATVFVPFAKFYISGALLSYWLVLAFISPYEKGAFEIRKLRRDQWIVIYFLTGALTGSLFYPVELIMFGIASLIPLVLVNIFKVFRHPPSQVLFLSAKVKWIAALAWLVALASRWIGIEL